MPLKFLMLNRSSQLQQAGQWPHLFLCSLAMCSFQVCLRLIVYFRFSRSPGCISSYRLGQVGESPQQGDTGAGKGHGALGPGLEHAPEAPIAPCVEGAQLSKSSDAYGSAAVDTGRGHT
ncbi:hypothetical protein ACLKA6_003529 [Drosophila palustris]